MVYPEYIDGILKKIEYSGEIGYIVGGSVRDSLLGKEPNDFDIAISCAPEKTMEIFASERVIPTGIKHGTVTLVCDGHSVEITTFRVDGEYTDSRHPDSVVFTDRIEEDLSRRDFTVNAMAYNPSVGLVDVFDGRRDLEDCLIRAVRDPFLRFEEDALRILRAFRFSATLGFRIEETTLEGAIARSGGLANIARERIGAEFLKLICAPAASNTLLEMKRTGIIKYVLGDYVPSDKLLSLVDKMTPTDIGRLGLLLSETDRERGEEILLGLRCSTKQIKGSLCIMDGARKRVTDDRDARMFSAGTGVYAEEAILASVLLGNSATHAVTLVDREKNCPRSLKDLKIGGRQITALGARGRDIGRVLERLLEEAIIDPTLNCEEKLIQLAKKYIDEINKEDKNAGSHT